MNIGTKSLLFGAHQFILHPFFVALAYIHLYGFTFDPRIWIAFIVHDWGYWGKVNLDGDEGKTHPEFGARIMHELFDEEVSGFCGYQGTISLRKIDWYNFTVYHSRFYVEQDYVEPSKLCYADKLAFCICPRWLYLLLTNLTGEIHEFMDNDSIKNHNYKNQILWYNNLYDRIKKWIITKK